jgi:hypothetical protein
MKFEIVKETEGQRGQEVKDSWSKVEGAEIKS